MPNKIKPRRSYTPNSVPLTTDLEPHELAINWVDGKAFTKDGSGNIVTVTLGGSGGGGSGLSWSSVPASATASGTAGQIAYDGSYFYLAPATNTWVRAALTTWVSPAQFTGLQLWLDASDASSLYDATSGGSLVAADGAVARWEDKSGNGRHATQSTSGSRPLRKAAQQYGRDTLLFDGSNDSMAIAGSAAAFKFLHSGESTVFIVARPFTTSDPNAASVLIDNSLTSGGNSNTGLSIFVDDRSSASRNNALLVLMSNANANVYRYGYVANNAFATSNAYSLISFVGKAADSTLANRGSTRINGGSSLSVSPLSPDAANSTADATYDLRLGATAEPGFGYLNGNIAELIIYNVALPDTDRAAVEQHLMQKWGIS